MTRQWTGLLDHSLVALLCCLYAAEALLAAYSYRVFSYNPLSAQLLVLTEALKLLLAGTCYAAERRHTGICNKLLQQLFEDPETNVEHSRAPTYDAAHDHPEQLPILSVLLGSVRACLGLAVPAVCYFVTNNLGFYAIQSMPAYTYMLLSNLKIITTGVLSCLWLNTGLSRQAISSFMILFVGVCIGQYPGLHGPQASTPDAVVHMHDAVLAMVIVAVLSAVAAVYAEWVMNHSHHRHGSFHLQNMQLYGSGVVLNCLYFLQSGGSFSNLLNGMQPTHWAVVAVLTVTGLVTSFLIRGFGALPSIKVYASCSATLLTAGISQALLHDRPTPAFFIGCLLTMTAMLLLQSSEETASRAVQPVAQAKQSKLGQQLSMPGESVLAGAKHKPLWLTAAAAIPVTTAIALLLLLSQGPGKPWEVTQGAALERVRVTKAMRGPPNLLQDTTSVPMTPLPPFQSVGFVPRANIHTYCPVMDCSQDATCTVSNKSCCAYFNMQMMMFMDQFLVSKCLQGEYTLLYGTALGARRNQSVLPYTEDIDFGLTPLATQYLEQNGTREEMWRHGYVFYFAAWRGVWKLCAHRHHPNPAFRSIMRLDETFGAWEARTGLNVGGYLDFWLMWPPNSAEQHCYNASFDISKVLQAPWEPEEPPHKGPSSQGSKHGSLRTAQNNDINMCRHVSRSSPSPSRHYGVYEDNSNGAQRKFCVLTHDSDDDMPVLVTPGRRTAEIGGSYFPTADNVDELLEYWYGPNWRSPNTSYHGKGGGLCNPNSRKLILALLTRLRVTAWGNINLARDFLTMKFDG